MLTMLFGLISTNTLAEFIVYNRLYRLRYFLSVCSDYDPDSYE